MASATDAMLLMNVRGFAYFLTSTFIVFEP